MKFYKFRQDFLDTSSPQTIIMLIRSPGKILLEHKSSGEQVLPRISYPYGGNPWDVAKRFLKDLLSQDLEQPSLEDLGNQENKCGTPIFEFFFEEAPTLQSSDFLWFYSLDKSLNLPEEDKKILHERKSLLDPGSLILLIRHGETQWNLPPGRWQGRQDSPLSPLGCQQASALSPHLNHHAWDRIYTSTSPRTQATARLAVPQSSFVMAEHFCEMSFGALEGLSTEEAKKAFPGITEVFERTPHEFLPPPGELQGETLEDVRVRALAALNGLELGCKILIFTHGFFIKTLALHFSASPLKNFWTIPVIKNTEGICLYKNVHGSISFMGHWS